MPKRKNQETEYFSDLGKSYHDSEKGWENYLRDIILGDMYGDPDLDRCPWARGRLRGGLDFLAAEVGPEKALAEVRELLDHLENAQACDWLEMHHKGMIKAEVLKLSRALWYGVDYDEPMN